MDDHATRAANSESGVDGDTGAPATPDADDARTSRRTLIKRAAKLSAVAWTVPMIIDGVTNPAAAATCAAGSFNVVYELALVTIAPNGSCTALGTNIAPATIGLSAAFTGTQPTNSTDSLEHVASNDGNRRAVKLTLSGICNCTITSVTAHVHRRGAPTTPVDCPSPGCQPASPIGALLINAGALLTTTVTVQPNQSLTFCTTGTHWGLPDSAANNNGGDGYMVVQITCL